MTKVEPLRFKNQNDIPEIKWSFWNKQKELPEIKAILLKNETGKGGHYGMPLIGWRRLSLEEEGKAEGWKRVRFLVRSIFYYF